MKYDKPVNVRFEKDVHKQLATNAKLVGLSISDLIRMLVMKAIRPPKKVA